MSVVRRISKGFSRVAWILLFLWLIRGVLGLAQYNLELAEGFLLFFLLARITSTEVRRGITTAVASLVGKLAGFFIWTWLFLLIAGTFLGLTPLLTGYTPQTLLAAIITGLAAIILNNLRRIEEVKLSNSPIIVSPRRILADPNISAEITHESILRPIELRGRTYGYVGHGELAVLLNTRIGEIKRTIKGAFAITGIEESRKSGLPKIVGKRSAQDADAQVFGYTGVSQFLEKSKSIYDGLASHFRFNRVGVWPFVQVEESPEGAHVRLPFMEVEKTSEGERVSMPFLEVDKTGGGERVSIAGIVVTDEDRDRSKSKRRFGRYTILGFNGGKTRIEARGRHVEMHAEDYLLSVDGDSTSLRRGDYSITLSESHASFNAPKVRAEVSQDGWATFRASDTYCRVSGDRITFEARGEERSAENRDAALKIYKKIADIVREASTSITLNERLDETQAEGFAKELREILSKL